MGDFQKLKVWKKAKTLAVDIYRITGGNSPFSRDFRFKDQIRSAAVSIISNIAEGDERKTNNQSVQFFYYAKGSAAELITQLIIAHEIQYLDTETFTDLLDRSEHISHMLAKIIQARSRNTIKPEHHITKQP